LANLEINQTVYRMVISIYCQNCGMQINDKAVVCVHCGISTATAAQQSGTQGVLGFVFGLLGLFLPIPGIDLLISIAGVVLSIIGVTGNRRNKGLAIAGLVISIIAVTGCIGLLLTPGGYYIWY
jgi:hypothetical protein